MKTYPKTKCNNEKELVSFILKLNDESLKVTETELGITFEGKDISKYKVRERNYMATHYPVVVVPHYYTFEDESVCGFDLVYLEDFS